MIAPIVLIGLADPENPVELELFKTMLNRTILNRLWIGLSVRNLCVLAVILASITGSILPVDAHQVPYSYLDLRSGERLLEVTLVVHAVELAPALGIEPPQLLAAIPFALQRDQIRELLRQRLRLSVDGQRLDPSVTELQPVAEEAVRLDLQYTLTVPAGRIELECRLFPDDPRHQTFVNIFEGATLRQQQVLTAARPALEYFSGTRQGVRAVILKFVPGGIEHIFIGPDHILFLIGLLLLGGSLRRLLLIVTAFTIAHSITLSLAALDLLNIPASIVEPAIALSIVYVGIDNLMVEKEGRDLRAWIAFFFGFIHGFGFAGVLREFGLPAQALGWSLFSFNLGVEIGQGLIVVVVATILAVVKKRWPERNHLIVKIASTGIIVAGVFWFATRVFL
jgi:hydrogenase/urease accessory protein HupE